MLKIEDAVYMLFKVRQLADCILVKPTCCKEEKYQTFNTPHPKLTGNLYGVVMRLLENIPLIKRERNAVKMIAEVLRKNFPVEEIVLFGSKSRGDDEKHSDIDLLIVTDQTLHWKDEKTIVELMFDAGMEYDVIFSPLFVSSEEWHRGIFTEFPVYKEIIRDGALVP